MQHIDSNIGIHALKSDVTRPLPTNLKSFLSYPTACGWNVEPNYKLRGPRPATQPSAVPYANFLQDWLFFGLLSTVVKGDAPLISRAEMYNNGYVTTSKLQDALQRWETFEKTHRRDANVRLMEAECALEYARQVVRSNLSALKRTTESKESGPEPMGTYPIATQNNDTSQTREEDTGDTSPVVTHRPGNFYEQFDLEELQPEDQWYITHLTSLSIMVLGETLSAHKSKIMHDMELDIQGWNSQGEEEDAGWGPPKYVLNEMRKKEWCPRTARVLFGQLGSSATLLLTSLDHHEMSKDHLGKGCNEMECRVIPKPDISGYYRHQHHGSLCKKSEACKEVMVETSDLYQILHSINQYNENEVFPIFKGTESVNGKWNLEVMSWDKAHRPPFATISHVWSDGLGNKASNGVYPCQLSFIYKLLHRVAKAQPHDAQQANVEWFWLDTLGIPVRIKPSESIPIDIASPGQTENESQHAHQKTSNAQQKESVDFSELKKRAISQIHVIYRKANHAIVIDQGLYDVDAGGNLAFVAMKILSSNWMRRLWTLQEAYLSKRLFVAFKEEYPGAPAETMYDLDNLLSRLTDTNREEMTFVLSIAQLIQRKVFHNMMGEDRKKRAHNVDTRGSVLIANAWRAVRWRSTSKHEDETLALATLLSMNYRPTMISKAGLGDTNPSSLEDMMKDFWSLLAKHYTGSIPPGIIFLSGEKLRQRGFRWAPKTWMSSSDEDHPHPLSVVHRPTSLSEYGLLVQYPGFILHCKHKEEDIAKLLGLDYSDNGSFEFPVDREFHQWYRAERADRLTEEHRGLLKTIQLRDHDDPLSLAIIVSRPNFRKEVPEIGLLVEVEESIQGSDEHDGRRKIIYYCKIIHRVRVYRRADLNSDILDITGNSGVGRVSKPEISKEAACYAEVLEPDQVWHVDGFDSDSEDPISSEDIMDLDVNNSNTQLWEPHRFGWIKKLLSRQPDVLSNTLDLEIL